MSAWGEKSTIKATPRIRPEPLQFLCLDWCFRPLFELTSCLGIWWRWHIFFFFFDGPENLTGLFLSNPLNSVLNEGGKCCIWKLPGRLGKTCQKRNFPALSFQSVHCAICHEVIRIPKWGCTASESSGLTVSKHSSSH